MYYNTQGQHCVIILDYCLTWTCSYRPRDSKSNAHCTFVKCEIFKSGLNPDWMRIQSEFASIRIEANRCEEAFSHGGVAIQVKDCPVTP